LFGSVNKQLSNLYIKEGKSSEVSSVATDLDSSYVVSELTNSSLNNEVQSTFQEGMTDQRFVRFMNPVFKYDFKVGNYLPDDIKKVNPHLYMSIKDITTGIRKSS